MIQTLPRLALALALLLTGAAALAQPPAASIKAGSLVLPAAARAAPRQTGAEALNAGTVSIISGGINGTYVRIAADFAAVLDEDNGLRVLPIIGKGSMQNLRDIMYLRGVDLGLVQSDVLEAARLDASFAGIEKQVAYVARLYNEELHVLAPVAVKDLHDLEGKKVNIDLAGSGTAMTARIVFDKLGIKPVFVNVDQAAGNEMLRTGEIAANLFISGKPVRGILDFHVEGFHLVPVPYDDKLQDVYLPSQLTRDDYPDMIKAADAPVETIAVGTVLAVYNWPAGSERYKKVQRFIDAFFGKFDAFQKPPRHPKWLEVNLTATVPGWTRFKPAQDALDRSGNALNAASFEDFKRYLRNKGDQRNIADIDQAKLFEEFLAWSRSKKP